MIFRNKFTKERSILEHHSRTIFYQMEQNQKFNLIRNSISSVFQQVKDKMEQIPFIQEQYFSNRTKFKPKRNIFVNFGNNIISLEQVWVSNLEQNIFRMFFFYFSILEH